VLPALQAAAAPIIAVSPLVGGQAIKGPTAKIMRELGVETSCISIVRHYPFLDGLVMDNVDEADAPRIDVPVHLTQTVMRSKDERVRLAQECLDFLGRFCS
jgi:LPPG:FO 2-phospho-L-lactate transferase